MTSDLLLSKMMAIGLIMLLNLPLTSQQPWTDHVLNEAHRSKDFGRPVLKLGSGVGDLAASILNTYMKDCHTLFVTEGVEHTVSYSVLRSLQGGFIPEAILNLKVISLNPQNPHLQKLIRSHDKVTCRVFLFDLTSSKDYSLISEFLESIRFFMMRHVSVVFVGFKSLLQEALFSHALWNNVHVLYLVAERQHHGLVPFSKEVDAKEAVIIYSRCLFCNNGNTGIELVDIWNPKSGFVWGNAILRDPFRDFEGHQLSVVQLPLFPFVSYTKNSDEVATAVTMHDSIDKRLLTAISASLNFTYEVRVPWDGQWGKLNSGNWSGMVGTLQHHKADFAMSLKSLLERRQVMDYTLGYVNLPTILIMSEPPPPPPYLAVIRPFTGEIWTFVLVSVVSAGLFLWTIQYGWFTISNEKVMTFDFAILSTMSTMFEEPAARLPSNTSGLMFMGWWWLFCTLITVVYKSSLTSHLTVPEKSFSFNSIEELIKADGWTWGIRSNNTAEYQWLSSHQDPNINIFFKNVKVANRPANIELILKGKHAYFENKVVFMSSKEAIAKTRFGYTPFYYGNSEYFSSGLGWAFRQNCPYIAPIDLKIHRLVEAGLIGKWINELAGTIDTKDGTEPIVEKKTDTSDTELAEEDSGNIVLSLNHLQSAFYFVGIGFFLSSLAYVSEIIRKPRS